MINQYIDQQLNRKNRGVYFKKGKWAFHAFFMLFTLLTYAYTISGKRVPTVTTTALAAVSLTIFLSFFYFYCLYLIPVCFKRNKLQKFWTLLLLSLAILPLLQTGVQYLLRLHFPKLLPGIKEPLWPLLLHTYRTFFTNFIGYTSMLYVMELLEEVRTSKEIHLNQKQLAATELNLVKTQMNPDFMIRSLDGIIDLSQHKKPEAPGAVVQFSDVLRYRLYRSSKKWVPLTEELQQLGNLFRFQNAVPGQENLATLETEGDPENAVVAPLSLINIAEALLTTYEPGTEWSLLFYTLIEVQELQIAVELVAANEPLIERKLQTIRADMQRLSGTDLNFTQEKQHHNYSLRICLPIHNNSIASS